MRSKVSLVLLALASSSSALQTISRVGRYLYGADGNRFYIKGMSYQEQGNITSTNPDSFPEPSTFVDPLADPAGCARDLPYMKELGLNAIRVYSVDSSLNHDACMSALSQAGIYTIIDLALPVNGSIDRASPAWTINILDLYIKTIDTFAKYDNVLAYNVGNEVAISAEGTVAGPFVKAAARDIKAYLSAHKLTTLVGYAAVDAPDTWRLPFAEYLSCDSEGDSIDLYGLNNYEWCGSDSFASAYQNTENAFANYNIPAYFSEYGCVTSPPRLWTEVQALFGPQMIPVWSGGLAFSYFPAFGGFGMVNISTDGKTVTVSDDFTRLQTQYATVNFTNSPTKADAGTTSYPSCPADTTTFLASTTLPPTPNSKLCDCVAQSFSCLFTPQTSNYTAIIGSLLDFGCSQLGSSGGNCDIIASNGQNGTYGSLSGCDPPTKLSYVMSSIYESSNRDAQACNFSGNATINPSAPPSRTAANAAAQSCLNANPATTFAPTSVPLSNAQSSTSSGSSATSSSTKKSSAGSKHVGIVHGTTLIGTGAVILGALASGVWVLL
ncbi:carbohydrate-binding module family 43 protein [Hydnum rufescens UP504]|uniref:1,3-beta-glucanosyltransferase n=1 Tax=Hydnum rufescens UP504 TaxID=1448309 RepID=A0A9P6DZR8_9AGAM|nr:carbohydrate-binding module family 43 protein [Hydnum rufescens UP504]